MKYSQGMHVSSLSSTPEVCLNPREKEVDGGEGLKKVLEVEGHRGKGPRGRPQKWKGHKSTWETLTQVKSCFIDPFFLSPLLSAGRVEWETWCPWGKGRRRSVSFIKRVLKCTNIPKVLVTTTSPSVVVLTPNGTLSRPSDFLPFSFCFTPKSGFDTWRSRRED